MKSTLRPLLMVAFVMGMLVLMQYQVAQQQDQQKQKSQVDPDSVIYSDVGVRATE